jgi:hypothetical protein
MMGVGPLEEPQSSLHLEVRDSKGNIAPFKKPWPQLGNHPNAFDLPSGSQRGKFLGPGDSTVLEVDLFETFDLKVPGKYTVQAIRGSGHDETLITRSNKITVTVVP